MSPVINSKLGTQVQTHHSDLINIYDSVLGDRVKVGTFVELGGCNVGAGTVISSFCFVCPGVTLGENCFLGPHVVFLNDSYPSIKDDFVPEKTIVGDNVIIGGGATILPGLVIGDGAKIGAGAIVTRNVAPGATVLGFPARPRDDVWNENPPEEKDANIFTLGFTEETLEKLREMRKSERISVCLGDNLEEQVVYMDGNPMYVSPVMGMEIPKGEATTE